MKRRWKILLILLAGLWLVGALAADSSAGSTFSASPRGSRALLAFFRELGAPAERWLHPIEKLSAKAARPATLIMIETEPIGRAAAEDLLRWVEQGNRVIGLGAGPAAALAGGGERTLSQLRPDLPMLLALERPPLPLDCTGVPEGPCRGVRRISSLQFTFAGLPLGADGVVPLAGAEGARQVLWSRRGQGDIWLFSEAGPALNDHLDKFDNARLLYQAATAGGHAVLFDEFHHGYTAPVEAARAGQRGLLILLAAFLAAAAAAAALSRGVRFGPPLPPAGAQAARTSEFAAVLGLLYREHGAAAALGGYLTAWKRRVQAAAGISARLADAEFVDALQRAGLIDPAEHGALRADLRALREGRLAEERLAGLISHLERILEKGIPWSRLQQQTQSSRA